MTTRTETGSLINHLINQTVSDEPKVGMGVTILQWTDRRAATIAKVTRTRIHTVCDKAVRIDRNGMSEIQEYEYEPDPNGRVDVFRMTKRGYRNASGNGLLIGVL